MERGYHCCKYDQNCSSGGHQGFCHWGIGGVHRGSLPDISADLPELTQTPIVVVSSGAKIILDLPATREWLETNGITIVGYQCEEMPAFYSRRSGLSVDVTVESSLEVAQLVRAQRALQITSALLVTAPVPAEFELPSAAVTEILEEALRSAERQGVAGRNSRHFFSRACLEPERRSNPESKYRSTGKQRLNRCRDCEVTRRTEVLRLHAGLVFTPASRGETKPAPSTTHAGVLIRFLHKLASCTSSPS